MYPAGYPKRFADRPGCNRACLHFPVPYQGLLDRDNIIGAGPFLTLPDFELDLLTFIKCCITTAILNFGIVDKKISSAFLRGNKSETLGRTEPFDLTFTHVFSLN